MSTHAIDATPRVLAEYGRSLEALLIALDSGLDPVLLTAQSDQAEQAFKAVVRILGKCSESGREANAGAFAKLRCHAALAQDAMRRAQMQVSERLVEVARAQAAMSQLDHRIPGESCDIAG